MRGWGIAIALFLTGCSSEVRFFLERVWPDGEAVILIVAGDDDGILEAHVLEPREVQRFVPTAQGSARIYARTYPELARYTAPASCTIRFDEAGGDRLLGPPSGAWFSVVFELGSGGKILLEPEPTPREFPIRLEGCVREALSCDVISSFVHLEPTRFGFGRVAAIDEDSAIATGFQRSDMDPHLLLMRFEGETSAVLPQSILRSPARALVRRGGKILGGGGSTLFELELDGTVSATAAIGFEIAHLSAGPDGTAAVAGVQGEVALIQPGGLELVQLATPRYSNVNMDTALIAVWSAERILLYGRDLNVYHFDGSDWTRELPFAGELDVIALDATSMIAVPVQGDTMLRSEATGAWSPAGTAFLSTRAIAGAAIGDGRYLIVGQSGSAAFWNGEKLCRIGFATDRNLEAVDFAPGARFGYAAGENYGADTAPAVLRLEIPQ